MSETLTVEEADAIELFFDRGWTDGLPVVPPTPDRVWAMLRYTGSEPDEIIGVVPQRNRIVTAEHAAINAVMAGCKPEYFPVVLAGLSAALDATFNIHAAVTSTGSAAICMVVSGPMAEEIGMASKHNALGPGNRANATIGRAVRLVARNVLGAYTGGMDGSSIGQPGKFTFCFAEDPPPAPWEPLRVALGYEVDDTTVTVMATECTRQVANQLNEDAEGVLRTFAAAMKAPSTYAVGKGGQVILVFGPEHAAAVTSAGWTRQLVQEFLAQETRVRPEELEVAGVLLEHTKQHDMTPGPDGKLPTVPSPDDIFIVTAGGAGAGWSAYIPAWAPAIHSRSVTRRVRPAGEALPDCGPDACEVQF